MLTNAKERLVLRTFVDSARFKNSKSVLEGLAADHAAGFFVVPPP